MELFLHVPLPLKYKVLVYFYISDSSNLKWSKKKRDTCFWACNFKNILLIYIFK